jgi:hypothetical protein
MQGLRAPTPRGRAESCTLRILTDAFTGAHGKKGGAPSARGVPRACGRGAFAGSAASPSFGATLDNGRLEA